MAKRLRYLLVVGAILGSIVAVPSTPSGAASLPVVCDGAGVVNVVPSAAATAWTISGAGTCKGDFGGTYLMHLDGIGTSDNIGLCGDSGVVTNLNIAVTVTLTNVLTLQTKTQLQRWGSPVTTFPVASPFAVYHGGGLTGGGTIFTRIFAKCPTAGTPVASYYFAYTP